MQGGRGEEKSDRWRHRQGQAEGGHFDGDLEAESIPPLTCRVWLGVSVPQVNGQNVVKVGHRQVVNMIRQGGNTLMVKVVMVTRHPDMDEAVHKKGAPSPDLCGQAWNTPPARHCYWTKTFWSPNDPVVPPVAAAFPSPRLLDHDPQERN